jgi:hypothetical protein
MSKYFSYYFFFLNCYEREHFHCWALRTTKFKLRTSDVGVRIMVFKATFNNISDISWLSVLLMKETGVPGENQGPGWLNELGSWIT